MKKYLVLFVLLTSVALSEDIPTLFGLPVGVSTGEFFNAWNATGFPIDFIVNGRGVSPLYIIKGHPTLSKELSGNFLRISTSISLHRDRNDFLSPDEESHFKVQKDLHIYQQGISIVYTNEVQANQDAKFIETHLRESFSTWNVCSNQNENFTMAGPFDWTVGHTIKTTESAKAPYILRITYAESENTPLEQKNTLLPDQIDGLLKKSRTAIQKYIQENEKDFKLVLADYDYQTKMFRTESVKQRAIELLAKMFTSSDNLFASIKAGTVTNPMKEDSEDSRQAFADGLERYATDQDIFVFCSGCAFGTNGIPDEIRAANKDWNPFQWMRTLQKIGTEMKK